tara:strand:+ start:228 stop:374 length:147 start_codon:yes stop_codon:yes gene_type:complete
MYLIIKENNYRNKDLEKIKLKKNKSSDNLLKKNLSLDNFMKFEWPWLV